MNAKTDKGLIRAGNRSGVRSGKAHPAETRAGRPQEPTACESCGALFSRRVWRTGRKVTAGLLDKAVWTKCPACEAVADQRYSGRIVIRGSYAAAHQDEIRKRIANVEERARFNQPERRIVATEDQGDVIEVLTSSQKLAHRVVTELKKAFRGRATYNWSDDGNLFAIWERN